MIETFLPAGYTQPPRFRGTAVAVGGLLPSDAERIFMPTAHGDAHLWLADLSQDSAAVVRLPGALPPAWGWRRLRYRWPVGRADLEILERVVSAAVDVRGLIGDPPVWRRTGSRRAAEAPFDQDPADVGDCWHLEAYAAPPDEAEWRLTDTTVCGSGGAFSLSSLTPGRYHLVARRGQDVVVLPGVPLKA